MKSNDTANQHTILKANWERYRHHIPLSLQEMRVLIAPCCSDTITAVNILPGGCANTNYKIDFAHHAPLVVRIYTREGSALGRERDILQLVEGKLPTAKMLFADESLKNTSYPYAVFSYVDGILLRDLIFCGDSEAVSTCFFEAGRYLARLSTITFPEGGFFEKGLKIRPFSKDEAYLNLALSLLKSSTIKRDFGSELVKDIKTLVLNAKEFLPENTPAYLSHGDFDASNIKVIKLSNSWRISGILDWEFAYAGTYFLDIGQMLRYSHKLPAHYESAFLKGIDAGGLELVPSWKQRAKIMDLLCLLQLAHSNPKNSRPLLNTDAKELVTTIVDQWKVSNFKGN